VLDEPNSNLDTDGERALLESIERVKARGGVVVVAHRLEVLAAVDEIVVMQGGLARPAVPRADLLRRRDAPPAAERPPESLPRAAPPESIAVRQIARGGTVNGVARGVNPPPPRAAAAEPMREAQP
jgi:ATP-binding cassette subfamily C protein/ATP-binding cassette subfamily C protein EexD